MFDTSLLTHQITGDTAIISFRLLGGRATVATLADRALAIAGYVSHQSDQTDGIDWLEVTVSGTDINNIVDQAKVVLAG